MVRGKALVNCALVLLSLWLCIHSKPISVDQSQEDGRDTPQSVSSSAASLVRTNAQDDGWMLVAWPAARAARWRDTDSGLHYDRYLREVIEYLEKDPHFREKLQNANMDDIREGKLTKELDFVHNNLRTKLDELKREEMNRLRMLIKAKHDMEAGDGWKIDYHVLLKQFEHLNQDNPHSFESEDLDRLIKAATKDLEHFDRDRHESFKRYEMMKEHKRREKLKAMTEAERKKEEERYEELRKKHADHAKVNHPGSEDQLKEVWEESDGLDPNDFDLKTFFKMHDSNGDGFFDENELEALFTKELEKVYDGKNAEDDMVEMEEERLRMREHVMNEVDTDKDRLVSFAEFVESTKQQQFHEKEEWETLERQKSPFTEEELAAYEQQLAKEGGMIMERAAELQKEREELQKKQEALNAQKHDIQQAMEELEKRKVQSKSDVKESVAGGEAARHEQTSQTPSAP